MREFIALYEALGNTIKGIFILIKEARYDIKFDSNEYGQDDEDDYIDEIESELKSMRIRAKVSSGSKDNTISFDTNVPKTKMIKILKDDIGVYVKESIEEVLDLAVYAAALLIEEERHLNKYKIAYHVLMERWDNFPPSDQHDTH